MVRAPTIYAVARTGHHVCMMADALRHLQDAGHRVQFARLRRNPGAKWTAAELEKEGFSSVFVRRVFANGFRRHVIADAQAGDTIVFAVRAGLDEKNGLQKLAERGVRLVMACEGPRFNYRPKYHPTLPIPFLAWGPSALDIDGLDDVRVVGAPFMERLSQASPRRPKLALINYKFTYAEEALEPDGAWGRAAIRAAEAAGYEVVVSVHPASLIPENAPISDAPVEELMSEATILISRASALFYSALMTGVQPFYLAVEGDFPRELSNPLGSYAFCQDEASLLQAIQSWEDGSARYDVNGFLDRHVQRDPNRSAAQRMADEIEKIHLGPPLVPQKSGGLFRFARRNVLDE